MTILIVLFVAVVCVFLAGALLAYVEKKMPDVED